MARALSQAFALIFIFNARDGSLLIPKQEGRVKGKPQPHSNLSVLCIKCLIIICRFVVAGLFTLRGDARKCAGFSHKAARIDQFGMREREFPLPHTH